MGTRELSPSLWTSIWLGLRGGSRISGKALYMYKGVCVCGGGILNKDIYDKKYLKMGGGGGGGVDLWIRHWGLVFHKTQFLVYIFQDKAPAFSHLSQRDITKRYSNFAFCDISRYL